MFVNLATGQKALEILQNKIEGDAYEAANQLATRMLIEMNEDEDNGLTDWLYSGDYDGNETIPSLIAEWRETTE